MLSMSLYKLALFSKVSIVSRLADGGENTECFKV